MVFQFRNFLAIFQYPILRHFFAERQIPEEILLYFEFCYSPLLDNQVVRL